MKIRTNIMLASLLLSGAMMPQLKATKKHHGKGRKKCKAPNVVISDGPVEDAPFTLELVNKGTSRTLALMSIIMIHFARRTLAHLDATTGFVLRVRTVLNKRLPLLIQLAE